MDQTERAQQWGVETGYFDVQGRRHEADAQTLDRIVEALEASGKPADIGEKAREARPAYQGNGRKVWILAVQLYGSRSSRNWGHGDFTDLAQLLEIVAEIGGAGIGLNPLHAQAYDRPDHSGSPYSPNTRLFFNPLHIDVEALEEFDSELIEAFQHEISRLRQTELIDHPAVAHLKIEILRTLHTP